MRFHFGILKTFCALGVTSLLLQSAAAATPQQPISYTDVGSGTPIVLIHAFSADKQLWQPQVTSLKKSFRVITLDLWGFGGSGHVNGQAVTMSDYADEVKQLLDQLHIQHAILGGESMGGYVALSVLEKYPASVSGFIEPPLSKAKICARS